MAGHSKWANIRHRKAGQDARRGKIFTKLIREITVAARHGGEKIEDNPRLRAAVDKALAANMTKDTIDRAISRGAGNQDSDSLEELVYEGYGPNGVAVMLETMTDNRNRTVADVRHCFSKSGGNLGTDGSVAYLFNRTGVLSFPVGSDEEALMEVALEAGAHDLVTNEDGSLEIHTPFEQFGRVRDALEAAGLAPDSAEVTMLATSQVELNLEEAQQLLRLVDQLEDLDDVQNVYSNAHISSEVQAALQSE